MKELNH